MKCSKNQSMPSMRSMSSQRRITLKLCGLPACCRRHYCKGAAVQHHSCIQLTAGRQMGVHAGCQAGTKGLVTQGNNPTHQLPLLQVGMKAAHMFMPVGLLRGRPALR